MDLSPVEERVLDSLDLAGLVATLTELIGLRTDGGCESAAQHRMAELLVEAGLAVDTWEVDLEALARHPAYCAELDRGEALGVVGRLASQCHIDRFEWAGSTSQRLTRSVAHRYRTSRCSQRPGAGCIRSQFARPRLDRD